MFFGVPGFRALIFAGFRGSAFRCELLSRKLAARRLFARFARISAAVPAGFRVGVLGVEGILAGEILFFFHMYAISSG